MNSKFPPIISEYYKLMPVPEGDSPAAALARQWNSMEDLVLSFVLFFASY